MQHDQPGERTAGREQVTQLPRVRAGVRAAMRVTNRYTMPPLAPRVQQSSDLFWNVQGQNVAAATSTHQPVQPLSPAEEDAWLNDVLPPARPVRPLDTTGKENGVSAEARTDGEVRMMGETRTDQRVSSGPVWPGHRLWSVVYRLSKRVCEELARRRAVVERNGAEVEELARECAVDILRADTALAAQVRNLIEAEQVMQAVVDEVSGSGPLAPLWRDVEVTEIMAIGPRYTVVERNGEMREVACHFEDEQHMIRIVGNILREAGRVFDPSVMISSARLPDGTFVNVIMPPGAVKGPTLTMRRRSKHVLALAELVKREMLSEPMAAFLGECVEARLNMVICGGLRSGRTTLLNALAALIPANERMVTIEDAAELHLEQKQVIALEARPIAPGAPGQEQGNSVSMRELFFNALRLRPERLVVGDCWQDEAGALLSALHTGYAGSLFNMYASGLQDCLNRLEMMWLANRPATPIAVAREQVARVVDVVIELARLSNGARKVMNIVEVTGVQNGKIRARSIFHYQEHGEGQGRFEPGGFVPTRLPALHRSRLAPDVFMAHPPAQVCQGQGQVPPPVRV